MAFWKRSREPLRRYQPPSEFPPTPLEELVEEGLLIALSGVRLSVKNRILVHVLRDGADLDLDWCRAVVGSELHALAQESADDAQRLAAQMAGKSTKPWVDADESYYEPARLPRRQQLLTMLAARLQGLATDEKRVRELAVASRDAALHDLVAARAITRRDPRAIRTRARESEIAKLRAELEELTAG